MMEKLYTVWTFIAYVLALGIGLGMLVAFPAMMIAGAWFEAIATGTFVLLLYAVIIGSIDGKNIDLK